MIPFWVEMEKHIRLQLLFGLPDGLVEIKSRNTVLKYSGKSGPNQKKYVL